MPKGCTCNDEPYIFYDEEDGMIENFPEGIEGKDWQDVNKKYWRKLNGEGNQLPCCEWWYEEEGWEI